MTTGRPPKGPKLVEGLEGPDELKERLEVILETLTGERTIASACEQLGIKEAQFHRIRRKALSSALAGLQPGTPGRKTNTLDARDQRIAELEARVDELETDLETAELRVEIATTLPNLLQEQARIEEAKKKSEAEARAKAKRAAAKRARKSAKKKRRRNRS